MPALRDWKTLGRETFRSVTKEDWAALWGQEWRSARAQLISEQRVDIEGEPRRWKRAIRSVNAVVFGLTRRLQPVRRVVFAAALLMVLMNGFDCRINAGGKNQIHVGGGGFGLLIAFLLVALLLSLELVDKIRFRDELELARELQASLLPKTLPELPAFELGAWNRIANMVGGDVYDFVPLPDGRLAVLFGDASGHGMAAGLVMAVAHAGFRTQLETDPSPEAVIPSMNRLLCRAGGPRSFFSCVYILASSDGRLRITVSGHPQVLRMDQRGVILERYGKGSYPLGIRSTLEWPADESSLQPGESLVLYSDGLPEARNAAEEEFGDERIEDALRLFAASSSAATLVNELAGAVNRFCGRVAPEDDVSIAVVRFRGTDQSRAGTSPAPADPEPGPRT